MNIDYLDKNITACLTLRKLKGIKIMEDGGKVHMLRAQLHPLIVAPFGMGKSSISKILSVGLGKDLFIIDNFTKASIEGTISKEGEYVPSVLVNVRGKIFFIDEWNSLDSFAQNSMLSVLENQRINRSLGITIKRPYHTPLKDKQSKYGTFKASGNLIEGEVRFGCIACAMAYPIYYEDIVTSQKQKAILSRFSPLFIQPDLELCKAVTSGQLEILYEDYSSKAKHDIYVITNYVHNKLHTEYFNFVNVNKLMPEDSDEFGYVNRALSEIIRYGVVEHIKRGGGITIDDISVFTCNFSYIRTILLQYLNPKTKGGYYRIKELHKEHPEMSFSELAQALGMSKSRVQRALDKNKIEKVELGKDEIENVELDNIEDGNYKIVKLHKEHPEMSFNEIAQELKISKSKVQRALDKDGIERAEAELDV